MPDNRISSRTPEGDAFQCPLCGKLAALEISVFGGDAVCPSCGQLLVRFRDQVSKMTGMPSDQVRAETTWTELGLDSLDTVELIMRLEELWDVSIPQEELDEVRTLGDLLDLLERLQREQK